MHFFLLAAVLPVSALLSALADVFPWSRSVLLCSLVVQSAVIVGAIATREAPGSIGGHWLPGLVLIRGAVVSLSGDGFPVVVRCELATFAVLLFVGIIVGEIVTAGVGHFYNWIHLLIYALGGVLSANSMLAAEESRLVRCVVDPACLCAMSFLFIGHVHDTRPLPTLNHTYLGYLLITLALSIFCCAIVHAVLPQPTSRACRAMRLLNAFAYLLAGTWLLQMAIFFYSSAYNGGGPGDGLHALLEQRGFAARSPTEAALFYLALTVLLSALVLSMQAHMTPARTACATLAPIADGAETELAPMVSGACDFK